MKVKHLAIAFGIILGGLVVWRGASALQWQDEVDIKFTFNTALSVSLSSEGLWIDELSPSTAGDSNEIDITVKTNNSTGYKLFATVGDASHNYRTLLHANGTNNFASLDVGSSVSSFPAEGNTWGYSTDAGTTYSGLPLYSDESSSVMLNSSVAAITQTTPFLIGARAQADQAAGDYTNVINFTAVTNAPPLLSMQGMAPSQCVSSAPTTVVDERDGQEYKVQRLADGNCWMLDNLRLDLSEVSLDTLQGRTNATDQALTYLKNGGGSAPYPATGVIAKTADGGSWANSYNAPYIATSGTENGGWTKDSVVTSYGAGSGKIGVYYNFCAASAGSYCYDYGAGAGDAGQDICPAGWRMPTGGADTVTTDGKGEYQALYSAYSSDVTNFKTALSTPLSGYFYGGSASALGSSGYFWSSTRNNGIYMLLLYVDSYGVYPMSSYGRNGGDSVRCVRSH